MPFQPKSYLLTNEADGDLEAIFDYTEAEHSFDQAVKYLSELDNLFKLLVKNPQLGRKRKELNDIFSIAEQEHVVFYEKKEHILILRVLHNRSDIPKHFKKT